MSSVVKIKWSSVELFTTSTIALVSALFTAKPYASSDFYIFVLIH